MISTSVFLGLALLPFVHAKTIDVAVGKGGLTFNPPALSADIGDDVVFTFFAKNHTVTQTAFGDVCNKKEGGIDSGFQPVAANTTDGFPSFTVHVTTKDPQWFYCAQAANLPASHCGAGMVFSINCPFEGANSFDNFKAAALEIGKKLAAGGGAASSGTATAAYGGYTIPPEPAIVVVTQPVTVGSSAWTTTYSSYAGSPAPTPDTLEGKTHTVIVGGSGGLIFDPPRLDAKPRDKVVFEFHQKNHSVVQSSFADPCRKADNGFLSGLQPVADGATEFPTFTVLVNDTNPIWAYCSQKTPASHCGAGMVFAINSVENSERNFSAFQGLAKVMNGTAAAANSQPSASGTSNNNGAISNSLPVTSLAAVFGAMVLAMAL
jgi:plastocyanin